MRDVTLLIAHPDDESLFLWPFLERVKRIVCASNDRFNPARQFCRERGQCLADVGKLLGAEICCFDYDSEFYRLPKRDGQLKILAEELITQLQGAEIIASHNAFGEYGNLDHILCHHIVRTVQARTGCELLVTDIATEINWLPVTPWSQVRPCRCDWSPGELHVIDRRLFDRIKQVYDARGCWTWSFPVQETCRVYSL